MCVVDAGNFYDIPYIFSIDIAIFVTQRGGVAQWVARLTPNVEVMGSSPIKGPRYFFE